MTIRAVLFDVGGPLDTEVQAERYIDEQIRARLVDAGIAVSPEEYAAANDWAVASFAPDAYSAIIWRLSGERADVAAKVRGGPFPARMFELREGMAAVVRSLHGRGILLGLAANQPARIVADLDRFGVGQYFSHREVTGHHGYRKPDVRLFLRACEDLRVEPTECVMVGDRIDNDIVPAKLLGMRTVLFRTGRHIAQRPRSVDEVPDAEAWDVAAMEAAVSLLAN